MCLPLIIEWCRVCWEHTEVHILEIMNVTFYKIFIFAYSNTNKYNIIIIINKIKVIIEYYQILLANK